MKFDKHVFISYAHIDNKPLTPEQQGWVSRLHASLEAMLSMRLGHKAEIWRDAKLTGNDIFAEEIVCQFPKTAVLVSVLSPPYMESVWCARELREFCLAAEQSAGLLVENKARLIKVIKSPVESEAPLPAIMREMLGYAFYTFDADQTPLELDLAYGAEIAQKYNLKVAKLAWDIAQLIKKLDPVAAGEPLGAAVSSKPAVYLAECSYDRREDREALEAELRLHGYAILPDRPLPREEADYSAEVTRLLARCALSVHMVGGIYGAVPDGPSQKSVVVLQNEAAIQSVRSRGLRRVIWLPDSTRSSHPEQQAFIESLHRDAEAQFGADLITADLEVLKSAVHAALKKAEKPAAPPKAPAQGGAALVYLICDQRDRKATLPVRRFLKDQGIDAAIPVFEGDAATVSQVNQDQLTRCDAAIIFYGAGDEAWKGTVVADLRRIQALRAGKPLRALFTYICDPLTDDKNELMELEPAQVINGLTGLSAAEMAPLLQALREE